MRDERSSPESDLDPRTDAEWEAARAAGHRLVDRMIAEHRTLRESPCWQPVPGEVHGALPKEPPRDGLGIERAMALAETAIQPYTSGNRHPRFWGWVKGAGTVPGILGGWMATAMNANVFGGNQGLAHLELQVLDWFRKGFGLPEGTSGLLVDGGSMANILSLAVARHHATGGRSKTDGAEACVGLRVYGSVGTHNSIQKGAELLGLGSKGVRLVATDPEGRIDVAALECAIAEDLRAGLKPFCIVGSACTVGTGAMDPLLELRKVADRHGLWFHVDGAIGALGWLSKTLRPRYEGMDLADSIAFDLHKWGQIPYDAGCLLVRDGTRHRETFEVAAKYLGTLDGGMVPHGCHMFHAYSPLLSRGDRALKIWMTIVALGLDRWVAVFEKNVAQAAFLGGQIEAHPELELLAPVGLNIVCFRYKGNLNDEAALDAVNEKILVQLQETGFCVMSPFRVGTAFCLRVAISNHRTRRSDLDALVTQVCALGHSLSNA